MTPLALTYRAAFAEEAGSPAARTMGTKIPGDFPVTEKPERVRMHLLGVTGVRVAGYRAELARWAHKWGRRPRKWALKEAPSWMFSQLSMARTWDYALSYFPVQI